MKAEVVTRYGPEVTSLITKQLYFHHDTTILQMV